MEIVIDIPENIFKKLEHQQYYDVDVICNAILSGKPLPEHHGRLIDADALPLNAIDDANYGSNYIRIAPAIIEGSETE